MITRCQAIKRYMHFNSYLPDYAQEGKNDFVLPAFRFELE
jgi:hypothetical protein